MFLLVPAYPGCPGQTAVKWLLFVATVGCGSVVKVMVCSLRCSQVQQWGGQCGMGYGEGFPEKNEDFLLKCCFFSHILSEHYSKSADDHFGMDRQSKQ